MNAERIIYTGRCNGCGWEYITSNLRPELLRDLGIEADGHEIQTGHRIYVWNGPSSQLPRDLWSKRPAQ